MKKESEVKKAEALIYDYQRRRIERTYEDMEDIDEARGLFFSKIYPPPPERAKFRERDRSFVHTTRSRLLRMFIAKKTISLLEEIIELKESTDRFNRAMAEELVSEGNLPESLDDEKYFELSRRVSTFDDRSRQVRCAVDGFTLGVKVVLDFPLNLRQIVRFLPRGLIGNADLFDLAVDIYNAFHRHRNRLYAYREIMIERETARLKEMFEIEE